MNPQKMTTIVIALVLMFQLVCFGAVRINPNDDVTIRNGTNYNASSPFGLFVKNSGDVSYMEYTLGSVPVTEAKLVLHNDDTGEINPWTIVVKGSEFSFDETTFNATFAGSGWPQVGTIPNVMAVAFYEMDLTTWYNDNLGKTMSLFMTRDTQPSGSGPIFEDKEGTKTGNALTYGPRLEVEGEGGNRAPIVNAGPDQVITLPDTQATLAAEIQDDGDPNGRLNYWWEVVSQPASSSISGMNLNPVTITIPGTVDPNTPYAVTPTVTVNQVGVYTLRLNARDELKDTNDTVQITVWDPMPVADPNLVIYYNFNEGVGTVVNDSGEGIYEPNTTTFSYDGPYTNYHLTTSSSQPGARDPNWEDGPTGSPLVGSHNFGKAMFFDPDFHQAAIHDHSLINPDNDYLDDFTECTIMMWIKSSEINTDRGFIIFDDPSGNDQRGMRYDSAGGTSGGINVLKGGFSGPSGQNEQETSSDLQTTDWQHVAMIWKMGESFLWYINGTQDTGQDITDALGTPLGRYAKIIVGQGGKDNALGGWHGLVDDVKIFQRALTQEQIQQEAYIVNNSPTVDAGDSYLTWLDDLPLTTLAGTVGDGPPGDVADADVVWSITGSPPGSSPSVTKTSTDWANPTADFTTDTVGTYEITLTATDTTGLSESDTLEIKVDADACEAAQDEEAPSWTGFNVYDSDQNCVIDLIDYADFAANWLEDLRLTVPVAY